MRKTRAKTCLVLAAALSGLLLSGGCNMNSPYRGSDEEKNVFYTTFHEPPKHLDPAKAYSSDEYELIGQIYEPPVQYHYLIRPYRIVPLTALSVPEPVYYGADGKRLGRDAPVGKVAKAVYEIKIKKGVMYQDHPAFAKGPDGAPLYYGAGAKGLGSVRGFEDFKSTGTRELKADDYILEIMRLADPRIESPVFPILEKYILGLGEYSAELAKQIEATRRQRKERAGAAYSREADERADPIVPDYARHKLAGVRKVNDYAFTITLKRKYPQFIYWLAMPFFAPMPEEALRFYGQGALKEKNITLDRYPVGTGPYAMGSYVPNREIVLKRNRNFRDERYPAEGEPGDREARLLADAGKQLPFIDEVVFKLEKEAIPRWNKFLQGYYDNSGISSDSFDQAVTMSATGQAEVTDEMGEKNIRLMTSVRPSIYYNGFNMLDPTVGGYSPSKQKLRQAISIALDYEEYIEIFNNGRGLPAMSVVPPGIYGHGDEGGAAGARGAGAINPYVYEWDAAKKRPVRRSTEYAEKLMVEAGYPGGRDKDGRPLTITFDNSWTGPDFAPVINWYIRKFKLLGIQLENRTTDYNRFQEKMMKGNFQFFVWGWNADYPDPENFFFLLASESGKVKHQGENVSNYSNASFDALFKKMESMENSPERLAVLREMTELTRRDAPLVWGYYPVAFGLYHGWVGNVKSNAMANNEMKYVRVDAASRKGFRRDWNGVNWLPALAVVGVVALITAAAWRAAKRRGRGAPGGE